jgi:hypothetical protein
MKFKGMTALFALALIAGAAAPTLSLRPAVVSAASSGHVQATFTKWAIGDIIPGDSTPDLTDMVGVVGGQVGAGTFFGEVFSYNDNGTTTTIHAVYHINGSKESFVANNIVTVNDTTGIAGITGVVTGGSLDGAKVDGAFRTTSPCPIPTPGNVNGNVCFSGTLNVTP